MSFGFGAAGGSTVSVIVSALGVVSSGLLKELSTRFNSRRTPACTLAPGSILLPVIAPIVLSFPFEQRIYERVAMRFCSADGWFSYC
ncbi:MAG: hypothetical protein GXP10_00355 [Gammaproteobacteria bacterium]|nr:hypothetical protein [Gammaproteobacteria bacterium]